jgi:O-antigen/teichoic acid export membrane protein
VGSILAIFSSIRGLFATSIQRFINVAKAGAAGDVNKIFSLGLKIQMWLAVLFFIVVDAVGIVVIPHLNIPEGSSSTAFWVLQFSLLATVVTIITVPYDAVIIANERFTAYAVISLIECALKLAVVFLLVWNPFNRVIFYALLLLVVAMIIRGINFAYCRWKFGETVRYHRYHDRELTRQMSVFAWWQMFGNMGFSLMSAGLDFVINFFGGVVVNAARSVTLQVQSAMQQFVSEVSLSFSPRSMMLYKERKYAEFRSLMYLNSKIAFGISVTLALAIGLVAPKLLQIWLGTVPPFTVEFVQFMMLYFVVRSLHAPVDMLFKAAGQLGKYQVTEFFILASNLLFSFAGLRLGMPFYGVFLIMAVIEAINLLAIIGVARSQLRFQAGEYLRRVLLHCAVALAVLMAFAGCVIRHFDSSDSSLWLNLGVASMSVLVSLTVNIFVLLNTSERGRLVNLLHKKR